MNEREKLIELLKKAPYGANAITLSDKHKDSILGEIADYLLENGVVVLPCKVGDMVYIFERGSYIIPLCGQGKPHWEIKIEKCSFKYWLLDNHKFGVNMFFTREEAENALEEREDNPELLQKI